MAQPETFLPRRWLLKVPFAAVRDLSDKFGDGVIKRRDIFTLGDVARDGDAEDRRRLLVATMMWGYGVRGGRSYTNAGRVLRATDLDERLNSCVGAIKQGDVCGAYRAIDGLSGYNQGYFTKFLYFVARNAPWSTGVAKPLIFDSRVEGTLDFIGRAFGVLWESALRVRMPRSERYLHYCRTAQRWADDLDLSPGVAGAEQIELILFELFKPSELWFDVYDEMRRLATAILRDCNDGLAGPHSRAAAGAMNSDLRASCG